VLSDEYKTARFGAQRRPWTTKLPWRCVPTEKRAATLGYLLDESRQRHQPDDYARDAIRHYGRDIGRSVRAKMRHGHDLQEFAAVFTRGLESRVYEMETVSASPSEFIVLFHYCPYVNCWRQQGRDARQIETLCDICMEGIMR
jgi:predicted ArsR family transcriptional regulator